MSFTQIGRNYIQDALMMRFDYERKVWYQTRENHIMSFVGQTIDHNFVYELTVREKSRMGKEYDASGLVPRVILAKVAPRQIFDVIDYPQEWERNKFQNKG